MYNAFFDLKEKPFKLVPNPEFLFLGKSHEEALAHLTYATSQGDGFVEITGEVGTGKTTLCRVFLENLDKDIEAAYIFNSKIDSLQLLKTIHSELGIVCSASDPAGLTLALNEFLLKKKTQGKSVLLLIDEAQNLGLETLEQLRLLSNLETTRSKLLQIILVGQPELGDLLDSYEMRQLRQRINLSCHIQPMTLKETQGYIEHRVNIASKKPQAIFTPGAQKNIYRYSRGIPRLVNIACDRSLLAAYSLHQKKVTPSTVRIAIKELAPHKQNQTRSHAFGKKTILAFFSIILVAIFFLAAFKALPLRWITDNSPPHNNTAETIGIQSPLTSYAKPQNHLTLEKLEPSTPVDPPKMPLALANSEISKPVFFSVPVIEKVNAQKFLPSIHTRATRENVFSHIISLWKGPSLNQLDPLTRQIKSDYHFFKIVATQNSLQMLQLEGKIDLVKKYNLPAILGFSLPENHVKRYIAVVEITADNEYVIFPGNSDGLVRIKPDDLQPFLTGDVHIPWKDELGSGRIISETSSKSSIQALKIFLSQIGFSSIDLLPVYDEPVKEAVRQIQANHGLMADGIVGPLTKIMLYSEKREHAAPYLDKTRVENDQLKSK